ncbi:hypothetical protein [Geotalea sp. SG265]|uniref:hypothetical protein n=1 Tax=Geotalea sp. SG265 TaxID=2922867 RepID=UPI001FAE8C94|nr:hypothetical protein [Geotalea sp. SG265]
MKLKTTLGALLILGATCSMAGAFGLPKIGGGAAPAGGDPDAYLVKVKTCETLVNKSADNLFGLVASKEEQAKAEEKRKKLNAATDAKEKEALAQELRDSEIAAINKAAASAQLKAEAEKWDAAKKKLAADSLYNLTLGGLVATSLVPEGQNLTKSLQSNPMMLTKANSIVASVKSLGGIATGTTNIVKTLPPVFKSAKVEVNLPTSSSAAPVTVSGGI